MIDPLQVSIVLWTALWWVFATAFGVCVLAYVVSALVEAWVDRAADDLEKPVI